MQAKVLQQLSQKHLRTSYRKVPKFSDARKLCCNLTKIQEKKPNLLVFCQKDANGIANSEDPGPALFTQTYLSENFGSLPYPRFAPNIYRSKNGENLGLLLKC